VIYFRHAATDYSQTDVREGQEWWKNCQTHRNLSQAGRSQAEAIGTALRTLDIPIGQVLSSEYCRTVETAELMNIGSVQTTDRLNGARSWESSTEGTGREQLVAATRQLLATPPDSGVNTILVSHTHNFENPAHPVLDEIAEGEAAIFQPDGNGAFTLVARMTSEQWIVFAQ
jgi:phosphohistidine phosphatase SixA